jgi:single-strand DNA-binding protein
MLNRVILVGRTSQDPELRYTDKGKAVCTSTIVTTRRVKEGDNWNEKAEFNRITLWGKTAETFASYVPKGNLVTVEGRLQTDSYEKDGQKRYSTKVVIEKLVLMPNKKKEDTLDSREPYQKYNDENRQAVIDIDEDSIDPKDLPF